MTRHLGGVRLWVRIRHCVLFVLEFCAPNYGWTIFREKGTRSVSVAVCTESLFVKGSRV